MLIEVDEEPGFSREELLLVVYRWDRNEHLGWPEPFTLILSFPDSSQIEVEVPPSFRLKDGHSFRIPVASGTMIRERPQQPNRRIPRIIYNLSAPAAKQVSQEVRRLLRNVRRMTNLMQCTVLYLVLEDEACRKEVEASGIANFREAYAALRDGSYKADLMRFYMLYRYGGVYLDDKTLIRQSLDSPVFDSIFSGDGSPGGVPCDMFISTHITPEIAFMAARPGSPIMLKALETAIANIMARDYTDHRLGITGNYMFTKMLRQGEASFEPRQATPSPLAVDIGASWSRCWGEMSALLPIITSNDGIVVRHRFVWQRQAIPTSDWPKPATHYTSLWTERQVFIDGNPIPSNWRLFVASKKANILLQVGIGLALVVLAGFIISRYPPIAWL
jgi:hypothetical protein